MISDTKEGGLKMPHFESIVQSQKLIWIKRLLKDTLTNWQILAWKQISITRDVLFSKYSIDYINKELCSSPFYRQILKYWYDFYSNQPCQLLIKGEKLWHNKFILIQQKPVYYKTWESAGIVKLSDLYSKDLLLTTNELSLKYNVVINSMMYNSLIHAIPTPWKKQLKQTGQHLTDADDSISITNQSTNVIHLKDISFELNKITSNRLYWHIVRKFTKPPVSVDKWISEFPFLNDKDFQNYFLIPNSTTRETKLQVFQYKILNRVLPCQSQLYKWKLSENDNCEYCNTKDTLTHYLYDCSVSERFWRQIENWILLNVKDTVRLSKTDILFGIPLKNKNHCLSYLNFIILYGKWYIHVNKQYNKPIFVLDYLVQLKQNILSEKYIYASTGNMESFSHKWKIFFEALFL